MHNRRETWAKDVADIFSRLVHPPAIEAGGSWRYGKRGSLAVHIDGPQRGTFRDFEAGKSGGVLDLVLDSLVARIGMETEFSLSQAVASGDAFEHRPSERGHCVEDFSAELDLRDLPGEAAGFEFGANDALPTAHLRFYSAALSCTLLPSARPCTRCCGFGQYGDPERSHHAPIAGGSLRPLAAV